MIDRQTHLNCQWLVSAQYRSHTANLINDTTIYASIVDTHLVKFKLANRHQRSSKLYNTDTKT